MERVESMMKTAKKKLALYLAVLMVLPGVLGMMSNDTIDVYASGGYVYWRKGTGLDKKVTETCIEKNQKAYLQNYLFRCNSKNEIIGAFNDDVVYTSNNSSVASVDKKTGVVTAKKTGKAVIKCKTKNGTATCKLTVVGAGKLGTTKIYKKLETEAKKIWSSMPSKITADNVMKYKEGIKKFEQLEMKLGMLGVYGNENIVAPNADRRISYEEEYYKALYNAYRVEAFSTVSKYRVKVKSMKVSQNRDSIILNLDKKITGSLFNNTFISNVSYKNDIDKKDTSKDVVWSYLEIYNEKTGKSVNGYLKYKKGDTKAVVKLYDYVFDEKNKVYVLKTTKLKKGSTYRVGRKNSDFVGGKNIKA